MLCMLDGFFVITIFTFSFSICSAFAQCLSFSGIWNTYNLNAMFNIVAHLVVSWFVRGSLIGNYTNVWIALVELKLQLHTLKIKFLRLEKLLCTRSKCSLLSDAVGKDLDWSKNAIWTLYMLLRIFFLSDT